MKKILVSALTGIFAISLAACGTSSLSASSAGSAASQSATAESSAQQSVEVASATAQSAEISSEDIAGDKADAVSSDAAASYEASLNQIKDPASTSGTAQSSIIFLDTPDPEALGMSDARNRYYSTHYYDVDDNPVIMPLYFENAVFGISQADPDGDGAEELIVISYDETDSEIYEGAAVPSFTIHIYEVVGSSWAESATLTVSAEEYRYLEDERYDFFLDENESIYFESYGKASHIADGMTYQLMQYTYDGSTITENQINHNESMSTPQLYVSGSDYSCYLCMQMGVEEDASITLDEWTANYVDQFVSDYRAPGFDETVTLDLENGTMTQCSNTIPLCRLTVTAEIDDDAFWAARENGDYASAGMIDLHFVDYRN